MSDDLAPGPRRTERFRWAPLPTVSMLVGVVLCGLALVAAIAPALADALLRDQVFARVLGVTLAMGGLILARVAVRAAAGMRRLAGVTIATPLIVLGSVLLVLPSLATWFHDTGRAIIVPWVFAVPAIGALLISRWHVQ